MANINLAPPPYSPDDEKAFRKACAALPTECTVDVVPPTLPSAIWKLIVRGVKDGPLEHSFTLDSPASKVVTWLDAVRLGKIKRKPKKRKE